MIIILQIIGLSVDNYSINQFMTIISENDGHYPKSIWLDKRNRQNILLFLWHTDFSNQKTICMHMVLAITTRLPKRQQKQLPVGSQRLQIVQTPKPKRITMACRWQNKTNANLNQISWYHLDAMVHFETTVRLHLGSCWNKMI